MIKTYAQVVAQSDGSTQTIPRQVRFDMNRNQTWEIPKEGKSMSCNPVPAAEVSVGSEEGGGAIQLHPQTAEVTQIPPKEQRIRRGREKSIGTDQIDPKPLEADTTSEEEGYGSLSDAYSESETTLTASLKQKEPDVHPVVTLEAMGIINEPTELMTKQTTTGDVVLEPENINLTVAKCSTEVYPTVSNKTFNTSKRVDDLAIIKQEMMKNSHFVCHLDEDKERHFLTVKVLKNNHFHALLDSGSQATLISEKVFNSLKKDENDKTTVYKAGKLHNFNGEEVPVIGFVDLELQMGKFRMKHPTMIVGVDSIDLLIGNDCISRLSPLVDYHNKILWAQVKKPISLKQVAQYVVKKHHTHLIEMRPDQVEIHFRNSQIPEITMITQNGHQAGLEGQKVIRLDEESQWVSQIEENCLRFSHKIHLPQVVPGKSEDKYQMKVIADLTREGDEWFVPIHVTGETTPTRAKLNFQGERSFISETKFWEAQRLFPLEYKVSKIDETLYLDHEYVQGRVMGHSMIPINLGVKPFIIMYGSFKAWVKTFM